MRRLRRLVTKRAIRWSEQRYVVEGTELVRLALEADVAVEGVYVDAAAIDPDVDEVIALAGGRGIRVFELGSGVIGKVTDTVTPQPVLCVCAFATASPPDVTAGPLFVLVDVRDPGNAGTIVRTADAAGFSGVVFAGGSVDPYNPKVVRSSAGSLLWLAHWVIPDVDEALSWVGTCGFSTVATIVDGDRDHTALDWRLPRAVVLGNEAAGLDPAVAGSLDASVTIAMAGRAESLNVAVAASVLAFESLRQRRGGLPSQVA